MNLLSVLLMAGSASGGQEGDPTQFFIMMALMIGVFYFFFIRPQQKKTKEIKKFRDSLEKGARVVTIGGIHGKVAEVKENVVVLDLGNNVRIKVNRDAVSMSGETSEQEVTQQ
jgi:preprotein translocase subunit YajC